MYVIGSTIKTKKYAWLEQDSKTIKFDARAYVTGLTNANDPIPYKVMHGAIFEEVMGSSGSGLFVHSRIKSEIENANLTRFDFHPVTISFKEELIKDYFILRPENHCGPYDLTDAIEKPNEYATFMMAKYGFKIDPATFTQDLMMPEDKLTYVISDKAHEVLQGINPAVTGLTMTHSDNSISDC